MTTGLVAAGLVLGWAWLTRPAGRWPVPPARPPALVHLTVPPWFSSLRLRRSRPVDLGPGLVEATDLLLVAVRSGLNVRLAVEAVATRLPGPVGDELRAAVAEVAGGARVGDALDRVAQRAGDQVRPLTTVLASADRYGSPLAGELLRLAAEQRGDLRRRAEEAARRLPVKLLFPLVICILPAFALLTLAPLIAGALDALSL